MPKFESTTPKPETVPCAPKFKTQTVENLELQTEIKPWIRNVGGAFIIRIGFCGVLYYNCNTESRLKKAVLSMHAGIFLSDPGSSGRRIYTYADAHMNV